METQGELSQAGRERRNRWLTGGIPLSLTGLGTEAGTGASGMHWSYTGDLPAAGGERSAGLAAPGGEDQVVDELALGADGAASLAHDARNLLTALRIYSDLLEEPGVLTAQYRHYAGDLRKVATAGGGLLEKLVRNHVPPEHRAAGATYQGLRQCFLAGNWQPVEDLAAEVAACADLLAALAGPKIEVEVECVPCRGELWLSSEDLMRILVNLVRNAAEAMGNAGKLQIAVRPGAPRRSQTDDAGPAPESVVLSVSDSGPGILQEHLDQIFEPGFTTREGSPEVSEDEPSAGGSGRHRGMGLSIVRSLVEAAGGRVRAESFPGRGARFETELPIAVKIQNAVPLVTDSKKGSRIEC